MAYDAEPSHLTAQQTETLLLLREHILAEDLGKFNMNLWMKSKPSCGTVMCIGGTLEMLVYGDISCRSEIDVGSHIGLTPTQTGELFFPRGLSPYSSTPTQAVRVLDHYRATGKVDWSVAFAD